MSIHSADERTYDSSGRWRTDIYAHTGDVGGVNQTIYLSGDEFTDDSIRIIFDGSDTVSSIELRTDGVWNDTGFRFASSLLSIGRDLKIGGVGGFIKTINVSEIDQHINSLIPHIQFDAEGSLSAAHAPILDKLEDFVIFDGPATGEVSGTVIGQIFSVTPNTILHSHTHTTGSIAATADVKISYYKGTDNTGTLLNSFNIPSSIMPASTEFTIVYDDEFGFQDATNIFFDYVSDNSISLATNSDGDIITTHSGHNIDEIDVVLAEFVLTSDAGIVFDNDLNIVIHNRFP